MSDRPIQVGDLVVVVKPLTCCGKGQPGYIFKVLAIGVKEGQCSHCGHIESNMLAAQDTDDFWIQIDRLKRIPPLEELDHINEHDEVTA